MAERCEFFFTDFTISSVEEDRPGVIISFANIVDLQLFRSLCLLKIGFKKNGQILPKISESLNRMKITAIMPNMLLPLTEVAGLNTPVFGNKCKIDLPDDSYSGQCIYIYVLDGAETYGQEFIL